MMKDYCIGTLSSSSPVESPAIPVESSPLSSARSLNCSPSPLLNIPGLLISSTPASFEESVSASAIKAASNELPSFDETGAEGVSSARSLNRSPSPLLNIPGLLISSTPASFEESVSAGAIKAASNELPSFEETGAEGVSPKSDSRFRNQTDKGLLRTSSGSGKFQKFRSRQISSPY